jgi:hypothetical protein
VVGAAFVARRFGFARLGEQRCGRNGKCFVAIVTALQKQAKQFLDDFSRRAYGFGRLLGDFKFKYSRFYALREIAKSQMLGQALGLPLTMTAFAFIGVAVTSATVIIYGEAIPDPVKLIQRFDSASLFYSRCL